MRLKVCGQCANENIRAGCRVCYEKGKTDKVCLNFYPKIGTFMFLKFLRLGRLKPESVEEAKKLLREKKDAQVQVPNS